MLTSLLAATISCTAVYERLNDEQRIEQSKAPLVTTFASARQIVMQADLNNHNYSLRGDPEANEFLAFITTGPAYTHGVVANVGFNGDGQLRISVVEGTTVHKLICTR